jgi:hypothetical protein
MNKRLVVRYPDGMEQIFGYSEIQPPDVMTISRQVLNLVAVKRSYYLYKPMVVPADSHMRYSKDQR